MNQLCKVCGEPAAGFHFGAFTCEGCKSFFGRTYNNISSISECKNNSECVINKKNRTACKACRLRKCLLVGMSKSGSRYGRRSNWFKIHCLLQEQQQQQQHGNNHHSQHQMQNQGPQGPGNQQNFEQYIHHQTQREQKYQNSNRSQQIKADLSRSSSGNLYHTTNGSLCQMKSLPRNTSSPSDSGASSADPEDTSSNKEGNLDSPTDIKFSKFSPDSYRCLSEPLSTFSSVNGATTNPFLAFPHMSIPAIIPQSFTAAIQVQEEPIDLSVKPKKRCRTASPQPGIDLPKGAPLDLTLVRSTEPLSG